MIPCQTHNCHHDENMHDAETGVCKSKGCYCMHFVWPTIDRFPTLADYQNYLESLKSVKEKVKAILKDVPDSRNLPNKEFVFLYFHYVHGYVVPPKLRKALTDFETIRRMHQKLAEQDPDQYGSTNHAFIEHKGVKKFATEEAVTIGF